MRNTKLKDISIHVPKDENILFQTSSIAKNFMYYFTFAMLGMLIFLIFSLIMTLPSDLTSIFSGDTSRLFYTVVFIALIPFMIIAAYFFSKVRSKYSLVMTDKKIYVLQAFQNFEVVSEISYDLLNLVMFRQRRIFDEGPKNGTIEFIYDLRV